MTWSLTATPALSQLGATIGHGLSLTGASGYQPVDYTDVLENIRKQQQDEADRQYGLQKAQLDQQYKISRMNAQTQQERNAIDRWYNEQQIDIARARAVEDTRQFNTTTGYDLLKTAASLRGADDYFQASNYMRGVANDPNSGTFLNALQSNTHMPSWAGPSGSPDAVSLNSLATKMGTPFAAGGGTGAPGAQDNAQTYLNQIHGLGAAGGGKLGGGALEQLSTDELGVLKSGLEAPGADGKAYNWNDFLKGYRSSRIGNSGNYRAA